MRMCACPRRGERGKQVPVVSSAADFAALLSSRAWWQSVTVNVFVCVCVCVFPFHPQVDSVTSMLRGAVVTRAFEQTKCFTPARGLQGTFMMMRCFWWCAVTSGGGSGKKKSSSKVGHDSESLRTTVLMQPQKCFFLPGTVLVLENLT